ncbi:hypothetical protein GVN16_22260 [Emticicia sp. CRIBPO]|jgi:hypothetical protein|uniref:hypothetical protein n=1 Tax=Emticicia sp. CRIBPO TaxID=2683258 RepID=UPI0014130FAC|nr:hypothetical protein [Emticicia sp. CRIBPO]NBA88514.1 hypothetical protein [Emticicia sp. CRIBPO]
MINHSNENMIMDDANSPDLDKKLLGKVSSDFIKVCEHLKEASYQIRKRKFSEFPIFVLALESVDVGNMLFNKSDFSTLYDYKASFIEEFLALEIVGKESEGLFKENYKDPEEYCCLFVIDQNFAGFIYVPFPED